MAGGMLPAATARHYQHSSILLLGLRSCGDKRCKLQKEGHCQVQMPTCTVQGPHDPAHNAGICVNIASPAQHVCQSCLKRGPQPQVPAARGGLMSMVCARGLLLLLQRTLLNPGDKHTFLGLSAPRLLVGSSLQLITRARTENAF